MRPSLALLLLAPLTATCSSLGHLPPEFGALALEAPPDQPLRIALRGGTVETVSVPLGLGRFPPAAARRAAELVHPEGTTVMQSREWGYLGTGYRIEKHYPDEPSGQWRSVLVDSDGRILERTHSLPIPVVPQEVLATASGNSRRDVDRIDVVQNINGEEFFRIQVTNNQGHKYLVTCDVNGGGVVEARILQTVLAVDR